MEKQIQYFDSFKISNFKGTNVLMLINEVEGTETPIELHIVKSSNDNDLGEYCVIVTQERGSAFQSRKNFETIELANNFAEEIMKASTNFNFSNHGLTSI